MSAQNLTAALLGALVLLVQIDLAAAQTAKSKPAPARPSSASPASPATAPKNAAAGTSAAGSGASKGAVAADDASKKSEILNSYRWRRAMFELNEWLSAQPFYDQKQVEQLKANLKVRVAKMSSHELGFMLADMEAKFQIIESSQAQEARAWLAQYLSILSDKKREEVLKDMPNLLTMTAAQLSQEIAKIQQRRSALKQQQAAFDRTRQEQVQNTLQNDRTAQQSMLYDQAQPPAYSPYTPYRYQSGDRPFDNVTIGPSLQYYSTPYGGVGTIFSPSRY